jgi:hypothetical protein
MVPFETGADFLDGLVRVFSGQKDGHLTGFDNLLFPGF